MPGRHTDVLLITDDRSFRAAVARRRPPRCLLQCLGSDEVAQCGPLEVAQVWIDLDTTPGTAAPAARQRVYFHSFQQPLPSGLAPGRFIRKPCSPAVFEVLWAGVPSSTPGAPLMIGPSGGRPLPAWLLEFLELDLKALCRKCVSSLPPRLGYRDASLYLRGPGQDVLTLAETTHTRPIDLTVRLDAVQTSLMAAVARTGHILRTDRAGAQRATHGINRDVARPYPDEACLVAPLQSAGRLWGVLCFSGCARTIQTEVGLPLEEILAFLGRAVHHACAFEQSRLEARVDSLTGLFNQRWMMEALEKEIRRAERFGATLSILMLDLDGLKAVNDRAGHAAGDCLLRHLAGRISGVLRQFDGAARVGGDEFIIMLPATDLQGAQQVARRLLDSIHEDAAQYQDTPLPIAASIGAAEWCRGWDARQLIDAADRAMYAAKQQGRDKFVCHTPESPPQPQATIRLGTPPAGELRAPGPTRFTEQLPRTAEPPIAPACHGPEPHILEAAPRSAAAPPATSH